MVLAFVLGTPLVAGAAAALWLVLSGRAPARTEPWQPAPSPTAVGVRLLATELDGDAVVLDGVVADDNSPLGPVGWPVSVRLAQPESRTLAAALCSLFLRWVAEDTVVRFAVDGAYPRRRVSVTDGLSIVQLALRTAPDWG